MIFYRQWHKVSALTFDLDDTLYDNHPFLVKAEQQTLSYIHQHFPLTSHTDVNYWRNTRTRILAQHPEYKTDMTVLRKTAYELGFSECGYDGQALEGAIQMAFDGFYHFRSDFNVDSDTCEILEKLATHYPLVAITNGNVDLKHIGIDTFFRASFHASMQQPMKPHPAMFKLAQQNLGLTPNKILHVGDNLEKDVMGANKAGFKTAWYAHNRAMQLKNEAVRNLPDVELSSLNELTKLLIDYD